MELRDDNGFLIVPQKIKIGGYTIEPMRFGEKVLYDVYLGDRFRETFNTIEDAKTYINQPKF